MARAYLALGSNVAPERHVPAALAQLAACLEVLAVSPIYESAAVGAPGTPAFWNATALVATELPPAELKHAVLRRIEAELGRVRSADKNAPRTIDLDLVLYEDLVLEEPGLRLPDPDLERYPHVAVPLADLAPELRHPVTGETLAAIAARLGRGSLTRVRLPT
jgi:2-amino-4-hydroxy-6-hydroxymethyldihydropteridine diphosphokinase